MFASSRYSRKFTKTENELDISFYLKPSNALSAQSGFRLEGRGITHFRLGHFRLTISGWPFQVGPFQVGAISG